MYLLYSCVEGIYKLVFEAFNVISVVRYDIFYVMMFYVLTNQKTIYGTF